MIDSLLMRQHAQHSKTAHQKQPPWAMVDDGDDETRQAFTG
jgi:hypothetical protein